MFLSFDGKLQFSLPAKHAVRQTVCKFANRRCSSKVTSFLSRKGHFFGREYTYISTYLFNQMRVPSKVVIQPI